MRIYIAALYARRFLLRPVRTLLEQQGHEVTSQWLDNAEESKSRRDGAIMDCEDVDKADLVLFFGEPQGSSNRGGGRWFEFGYGYAKGKTCVAVLHGNIGQHESVFTALPGVALVDNVDDALVMINAFDQRLRSPESYPSRVVGVNA